MTENIAVENNSDELAMDINSIPVEVQEEIIQDVVVPSEDNSLNNESLVDCQSEVVNNVTTQNNVEQVASETLQEVKENNLKNIRDYLQTIKDMQTTNSAVKLTASIGVIHNGPSGKETYYNLKMNKVVENMRKLGFSEEAYPYYVREDGAKCLGPYVMVAANLSVHPRGTTLETTLGTGLVCDTGDFAKNNPNQIDIATDWSTKKSGITRTLKK